MNYLSSLVKLLCFPSVILFLSSCSSSNSHRIGDVRVVAGLDFTPAGVSVSSSGKVFVTKHALRTIPNTPSLVELTSKETYQPFPDSSWNFGNGAVDRINTADGILIDSKNWVWILDHGNFISPIAQPKVLAFDIATKTVAYSYELPPESAKIGSFLQHIAVDEKNGFVFVTDVGLGANPAIIVIDINNSKSWRYEGLKEFEPENIDMYVSNRTVTFPDSSGKHIPARVGLNAITLSTDAESLFFGAMSGLSWYKLPAKLLREHRDISELKSQVIRVGAKPICDGVSTDSRGIHYFTNLGATSIDYLDSSGILKRLVTDKRLRWAESIRVGPGGWLYIATSQIDRSPLLNGGKEEGGPPYLILKVYSGSPGEIGK